MPVYEAPDDPDDGNDGDGEGGSDGVGEGAYSGPRQSYNFAPSYRGVVYRAEGPPDWGAGRRSRRNGGTSTKAGDAPLHSPHANRRGQGKEMAAQRTSAGSDVRYKLQTMKWGLVPFWTKSNPGYGSLMKTITAATTRWHMRAACGARVMKAHKRCVVIAQGFYEWLKKDGGREKLPHYVKRKDGKLMCFAGLWDVVQYDNDKEKQYTYTIITTNSNKQLNFLHDRMPVILENGSEKMRSWLDHGRCKWSKELQSLLTPYHGELEVYPVNKDVGKVGNNSPSFIVPIDSKENKSNIANFFARGPATANKGEIVAKKEEDKSDAREHPVKVGEQPGIQVTESEGFVTEGTTRKEEPKLKREDGDEDEKVSKGVKREAEDEITDQEPPSKMPSTERNRGKDTKKSKEASRGGRQKISATSNNGKSPIKTAKTASTQKITKFFPNSS